MTKHIIIWTIKDEYSQEEKLNIKKNAKIALESLKGKVPGLIDIKLNIDPLGSSNSEMMLDSALESEDALKAYQVHPAHVAAANEFIRPFTQTRLCFDFEE